MRSIRPRRWLPALCILALAGAGCATVPAPIPVSGASEDVARLAGDWYGEYRGTEAGRSGVLEFHLAAGADTATGDVLMLPRDAAQRPGTPATEGSIGGTRARSLTITFVRAEAGRVVGRLDPYPDPDCNCQVTTVFEGRLQEGVIEGTYTSHRSGTTEPLRGTWQAKRKP